MKKRFFSLLLAWVMLLGVIGTGLTMAFATGSETGEPGEPGEETTEPGEENTDPVSEPEIIWVTYVDGDGTVYLERTEFVRGESEPEAPADPVREGYTFTGWHRAEDEDGNITYTAAWEQNVEPAPQMIWVTYVDSDGITVYLERTEFIKGRPEPGAPADPVRDGYTFAGWDRSEDKDGNITYTAAWEKNAQPTPPAGNVDLRLSYLSVACGELYPAFSPNIYSYTVYVTPEQENRSCRITCDTISPEATVKAEGDQTVGRSDVVRKIRVSGGGKYADYTVIIHVMTFREFLLDGELYTMTDRPSPRNLPGTFTVGQINMFGEKVTAAQSTDGQLILVQYLAQSEGKEPIWYRYEPTVRKLFPVSVVTRDRMNYIVVDEGKQLLYGSDAGVGTYYVYDKESQEWVFRSQNISELTVTPAPIVFEKGFKTLPVIIFLGLWAVAASVAAYLFYRRRKQEKANTMYFRPYFSVEEETKSAEEKKS